MSNSSDNGVKLSVGVTDHLIPSLVDLFYDNGEGMALKSGLQGFISEKSQERAWSNFQDVFGLLDKNETKERFEGFSIVISNIDFTGYDDFCHLMDEKARELGRVLADDPIIRNRDSGEISASLYQEYASLRIMEACISIVMDVLMALFDRLPFSSQQFMSEPLANLPLSFGISLHEVNSREEMIRANLIKFEDIRP